MDRRSPGFTLIELIIVIGIIAIVAAISIPNLLASKLNANETAAIATMRHIVSSQAQIAATAKIDADRDGRGEYGTFLELSGAVGVRQGFVAGPPSASDFSRKGEILNPPILSSLFARVDANGFTTKAGYAFMLYLPDTASPAGLASTYTPGSPSDTARVASKTRPSRVRWSASRECTKPTSNSVP